MKNMSSHFPLSKRHSVNIAFLMYTKSLVCIKNVYSRQHLKVQDLAGCCRASVTILSKYEGKIT